MLWTRTRHTHTRPDHATLAVATHGSPATTVAATDMRHDELALNGKEEKDGDHCAHLGVLADDLDRTVEEVDEHDGVGEEDNRGKRPRLGLELLHLLRICKMGKARMSCRKVQTSARSKGSSNGGEFDLALLGSWRKAEGNWRRWWREEGGNGARVERGRGASYI